MSTGVTTHRDGHVLEVTLERGKVNAIDVPDLAGTGRRVSGIA